MGRNKFYSVQLRVPGVNGHGETWRGVMNDRSLRLCRKYVAAQPHPYRIVRMTVIEEQSRGELAVDHLMELARDQGKQRAWEELAEWAGGRLDG